MKEAMLYEKAEGGAVHCFLCSHHCHIPLGGRGRCGVRENCESVLYSLVYGKAIAANPDPIEKKPLFHFLPGSASFSLAAAGCNFACLNCQNWDISQAPREEGIVPGREIKPEEIVSRALRQGCGSISYTYTEPTIFFEYAYDTARAARERGLKNVFVTNGYMTLAALKTVAPCLDAANVDLKSFRDDFYRKICSASLQPVLDSISKMLELKIWVEATTLIIPGYNDSERELKDIADFLRGLSPDLPWHVSGFHPNYRLTDAASTPPSALRRARRIGREAGLKYVYTGNLPGDEGENTFCSACRKKIIGRSGFRLIDLQLQDGRCSFCGETIAGIWS